MNHERGILIAGNWKMNHSANDAERFITEMSGFFASAAGNQELNLIRQKKLKTCIFPSFLALGAAISTAKKKEIPLEVGAQNAHWEKKGAFTGEVSGPMLQEIGASWVLVGHSERRQLFGETDALISKRAWGLLNQGFQVILCVGETRSERETGKTEQVLTRQLQGALLDGADFQSYLQGQLVIAYEPVWAIGTGLNATPEQAEEAHRFIRKFLQNKLGKEASEKTSLLYGGSVTPENIDSLLACTNVDGALVGGASLKSESFSKLISAGASILRS